MSKDFDSAIVIGRFTPFHEKGHGKLILKAASLSDHIIIFLGSSNQPLTEKNPFTDEQREFMLMNFISSRYPDIKVTIFPIKDYPDDARWYSEIHEKVSEVGGEKVTLVGYLDQDTSYLNDFPTYAKNFVTDVDLAIHATEIRKHLFTGSLLPIHAKWIPVENHEFILDWLTTDQYIHLKNEYDSNKDYKEQWSHNPHQPIFVTTDAVIEQSGFVLMVNRKFAPGRNLWALPGGFLSPDKTIIDSCYAKVKDKTGIKIQQIIFEKSIKDTHIFDKVGRSLRGRTISHSFYVKLKTPMDGKLPKVKLGEMVNEVKWIPLSDLKNMGNVIFEDHLEQIMKFINF